ncbi:hypothetical protein MCEGKSH29_00315 [Candidatus Nanopelagicaceae bacterium]
MIIKKKIALIAAGAVISAGALFAVVSTANAADTSTTPAVTSPVTDSGYMDANEANEANEGTWNHDSNEANDPADANEANEGTWNHDGNEANDPADANEANEGPKVSGK